MNNTLNLSINQAFINKSIESLSFLSEVIIKENSLVIKLHKNLLITNIEQKIELFIDSVITQECQCKINGHFGRIDKGIKILNSVASIIGIKNEYIFTPQGIKENAPFSVDVAEKLRGKNFMGKPLLEQLNSVVVKIDQGLINITVRLNY